MGANSSRVQISYKPEATFGLPVTASACYALRNAGESLNYDITFTQSAEIRADRQDTDPIAVDADSNGGVKFEFSYGEYDWFIQAALQGTWNVFGVNGVGASIPTSATFAASTLTAGAATSGASIFTNLAQGQWVKIAGSTISGQNIWAQVSKSVAPTSTVLTFEGTPFTGLTGNGGTGVTVSSSRLTNGVIQRSCTIEKLFADVTQYFTYEGETVDGWNLSFQPGSKITGSFDVMGETATNQGTTRLHATVNPSTNYKVMNAVTNMANVLENGAAITGTFIKSMSFKQMNNLYAQDAIANGLGNAAIGSGNCSVSGTLEIYFSDGLLYQKFINNTTTSLSWRLNDGLLNGYVFTLPNVTLKSAKVNADSINQPVVASFEFSATRDATSNSTIIIDRAGAAVTLPS